ncbi:hypothetical protein [Neorhizobium sp. DAR64860/K0K1]|uniref:hypothetical protein n=1 Tax=Neorhizobium sp. DAR64860/K0K1 TaxID=3421955 RepID=UPI003D297D92
MVSGIDVAEASIEIAIVRLRAAGVTEREVNVALLRSTLHRWHEEVGEDMLKHVLRCEIDQIDQGAYRDDYVSPEALMADEDEARERRQLLTVIEGGGGSKV